MENDSLNALLGQLHAMSMALTAVISSLPAAQRAAAAIELQAAGDVQREADELEATPPACAHARDRLLALYEQLLLQQPPHS